MEFDIRNGKLIKCIPSITEHFVVENGKKMKAALYEVEIDVPPTVNAMHKDAFSEVESYVEVIRFAGNSLSFDRGSSPFRNCKMLREVVFSRGSEVIPRNLFLGKANLEKVMLPQYMTGIGAGAFKNCSNLKEVNIPMGLEFIGGSAFKNCTKLKIDVLDPATEIYISAFNHTDTFVYPAENISISFGQYYQDVYGASYTPIIWKQIGKQDDHLVFISDKCLEYMYFDEYEALNGPRNYYGWYKTKWKNCSLRKWLNCDFLEEAFMPDERLLLQEVNGDPVSILTYSQFKKVNWFGHSLSRCSEYVLNKRKVQKKNGKLDISHEETWYLQDDREGGYYESQDRFIENFGGALYSPQNNLEIEEWLRKVPVRRMLCVRPIIRLKVSDAKKYII